jgi:hypothetical protein
MEEYLSDYNNLIDYCDCHNSEESFTLQFMNHTIQFTQITKDDGTRKYKIIYNGGEYYFPSVTTVIDKIRPRNEFNGWYKRLGEKVDLAEFMTDDEILKEGKKLARSYTNRIAAKGTQLHDIIENVYKIREKDSDYHVQVAINKRVEEYPELDTDKEYEIIKSRMDKMRPFFHATEGISQEYRVFYMERVDNDGSYNPIGDPIGIAGTSDALIRTMSPFYNKNGDVMIDVGVDLITDWKFPQNIKYPKAKFYNDVSYPLIGYALQLSAYRAGLRFTHDKDCEGALIVSNPDKGKLVYYYYYSSEVLDFYWKYYREAMIDVNFNTNRFDWTAFCQRADREGMLGERVYL